MSNLGKLRYIEGRGYIRESIKYLSKNINENLSTEMNKNLYDRLVNFGQNFIALDDKKKTNPEEYVKDIRKLLDDNVNALSWDTNRPDIKRKNKFDRGYAEEVYIGERALNRLSYIFPHITVARYLNVLRSGERVPLKLSYYKPISVTVDGKKYNGQVRVSTHEAIPAFFAAETDRKITGDNDIKFAISVVVKPTFPFGRKDEKHSSEKPLNNVQVLEFVSNSLNYQEASKMAEELSKKFSWLANDNFDLSTAMPMITDRNILSGDFIKKYAANNKTIYTYSDRSSVDPQVANIKERINKYLETNLPLIGNENMRLLRAKLERCTTIEEIAVQEKEIKREVRLIKKQRGEQPEEVVPQNSLNGLQSITYEQALEMFRNKGIKYQLGFKINYFNGTNGKCFGQYTLVSTSTGEQKVQNGVKELCTYREVGKPKNAGYKGLKGDEEIAYFINKVNNGFSPCLDRDTSRKLPTTIFYRKGMPIFIYNAEGSVGQQFIMISNLNESKNVKKIILSEAQLRDYIRYIREYLI